MNFVNELLMILSVVLAVIGIVGCIVPVIPGPVLSFFGLVALHFTAYADFSVKFFVIMFIAGAVVTVLDFVFPVLGTKKFGGTKRGIWGASIGLLAGLFFPPFGIIAGPFAGALIGEITGGMKFDEALLPSLGSLMGVLSGIVAKMIFSGLAFYYIAAAIFRTVAEKIA
ncbi:MAG: DUF456 domain-containing protein [Spirochaetes bacterium]|nr:DUF456 domain-containing protein [Spirochaetota bacterium]